MIVKKCPECLKDFNIHTKSIVETYGATMDCPNCGVLLLSKEEGIVNFHKKINSQYPNWPADGKGTNYLEINYKESAVKRLTGIDLEVGDRIRLIEMKDDPDPILEGDMGSVFNIVSLSDKEIQIQVKWDSGRSLNLICPPDKFEKI